ncbi:MAG: D-alanyl-D-alanine carboxypeptidase [bacterium]|nr:D-alanyl-D-alanine carboxypeptidase [bacterium]
MAGRVPVRRTRCLLAGLVFGLLAGVMDAEAAKETTYFVIDATNGNVLAQRKPDKEMYPASLAKMMTLYLVFEALEKGTITLDTRFTFSRKASDQVPSKLGIPRGGSISAQDAIMALVIKSANDVAVAVAEGLGGSEAGFTTMMTNKARELGMRRTVFINASGLHRRSMTSTARDMAVLALRLQFDFPEYYPLFSSRSFTYGDRTYRSHNKLLGRVDGVDGIKTGYTKAAGWNLAASAVVDGRRIVGVVIGGKDRISRDRLMTDLIRKAFVTAASVDRTVPLPTSHPRRDVAAQFTAALTSGVDDALVASLEQSLGLGSSGVAVDEGSAGDDRNWAIQVGAFSQRDNAVRASADTGRFLAPLLAGDSETVLATVEMDGATLYRVRILNLGEVQARESCRFLNSNDRPCSVIYTGES